MITSESFIRQFRLTNRFNDFAWATSTPVMRSLFPKMTTAIIVSLRSHHETFGTFLFIHYHMTGLLFFFRSIAVCFDGNLEVDGCLRWLVPPLRYLSTGFVENGYLPMAAQSTIMIGFLLCLAIYAFGYLFSFKPSYYYYPHRDRLFAFAIGWGSFSIHVAAPAFFTTTKKVITNGEFYEWVLSAISLLITASFSVATRCVATCYPSFCTVPGACWFFSEDRGVSVRMVLMTVTCTLNMIGSREARMMSLVLHTIGLIVFGIFFLKSFNYVSLVSAAFFGSLYFTGSACTFVSFLSFFRHVRAMHIILLIFILVPLVWMIVYFILKRKVRQVRELVHQCVVSRNYAQMPRNESKFLLYCCHSMDLLENDDIWKYGEVMFPRSFQFYYNYFRFLSQRENLRRMYGIIAKMHEASTNTLYQETILILLQVWLFYNPEIDLTGLLSSVIDSCLMILHLFWCESLHGQIDRLFSLSTNAHAKLCEVVALLYNIKCVKEENLDGNDSYQKLIALISEERINQFVSNFGHRMKYFVCDTEWLAPNKNSEKLFTLRRLGTFTERKVFVLSFCQHISLYGPFYFSFFAGGVIAWLFYNYSVLFAGYVSIFSAMSKVGIISGFEKLATVLPKGSPLEEAAKMYEVADRAFLYESVINTSRDIFGRLGKMKYILASETIDKVFKASFLSMVIPSVQRPVKDDRILFDRPFDPYVYNSTLHVVITEALEMCMTTAVERVIEFTFVLAIFVIIVCFVCQLIASKLEHQFLAEFTALPKTAITELIDKIGDRLAIPSWLLESVDPEVRFNLRILSYQGSSDRYPTEGKRKLKAFSYIFLTTVLLTFIIGVSTHSALYHSSEQRWQLCALWGFVAIPSHLLRLGFSLFRFLNESTVDNLHRFNSERDRLEQIFLPLLCASKINQDVIREHFLASSRNDQDACVGNFTKCASKSFAEKLMVFLAEGPELRNYFHSARDDPYIVRSSNSLVQTITDLINVSTVAFVKASEKETTLSQTRFLVFIAWCCVLLVSGPITLYSIFRKSIPSFKLHRDCTLAARSTLPENFVVGENSKLDEANVSQRDLDKGAEFLNSYSAFEQLGESVILIGDRNRIIACTPATKALIRQRVEGVFPDFLQKVCGERIEMHIGKKSEHTFYINNNSKGKGSLVKFVLLPLDNFKLREEKVNFACIATDITERKLLASEVNLEANRLRMFMTQLVPSSIAEQILEGKEIESRFVASCAVGSFLIESSCPLSPDAVSHIQKILRQALHDYPKIVFIGRSVLTFRVAIETGADGSSSDELVELVNFSLRIIESVRQHNDQVTVHCGIHITGPFACDVLKDVLPAYGFFGPEINFCAIVGSLGKPNRVNITRAVYDTLPHSLYDLSFYDEVKHHNHGIRVYQLQKLKTPS